MMCTENRYVFTLLVILALIFQNSSCFLRKKSDSGKLKDPLLNFSQLAGKYGYHTEEHSVTTDDGYILTIFRMRASQCEDKRPPVLLMHGLLTSSDAFIAAGPGNALGYLLADACFDVWAGNVRGNYYTRKHITLSPKDAEFWNFSFDQMGYYDNPAMVDHILNATGYEKLNYIGYSQGTKLGFIMCSERPGYCDKLNIFINLAPSTRHTNTKSYLARALTIFAMKYERGFKRIGYNEVLGRPEFLRNLINSFCQTSIGEALTRIIFTLLDSHHGKSVSSSTVRTVCGQFTAGTSFRSIVHYGQAMTSNDFRKFDYGASNIKIYGTNDPPSYNLGAATAPVVIFYGENDGMCDTKDSVWLASQLPNLVEAWSVPDPKWNHIDFACSQHMPNLVFPKIKEYLLQYNK